MPDPVSAYTADIERPAGEQLRVYEITFRRLFEGRHGDAKDAAERADIEHRRHQAHGFDPKPAPLPVLLAAYLEAFTEPEETIKVRGLSAKDAARTLADFTGRVRYGTGTLLLRSIRDLGAAWPGDGADL